MCPKSPHLFFSLLLWPLEVFRLRSRHVIAISGSCGLFFRSLLDGFIPLGLLSTWSATLHSNEKLWAISLWRTHSRCLPALQKLTESIYIYIYICVCVFVCMYARMYMYICVCGGAVGRWVETQGVHVGGVHPCRVVFGNSMTMLRFFLLLWQPICVFVVFGRLCEKESLLVWAHVSFHWGHWGGNSGLCIHELETASGLAASLCRH